MRGEYDLRDDGSVDVTLSATLYEGSNCDTDDKEDSGSVTLHVPPDEQGRLQLRLKSTGAGGGDHAELDLIVTNATQF